MTLFSRRCYLQADDKRCKVWRCSDGSVLHDLGDHVREVTDCAFSSDGNLIFTAAHDETAKLWQLADGAVTLLRTFCGHTVALHACSISKVLHLYITHYTHHPLHSHCTPQHLTPFTPFVFQTLCKDASCVATASYDGTAKIWAVK